MARLIVRFPDGEARREPRIEMNLFVTNDKGVDLVGRGDLATDWIGKPKDKVEDERPIVVASERMWHRKTGHLMYRAGQDVPEDELPSLISDSERSGR